MQYFIVYSPKVYNLETVNKVIEKYNCVLVVEETGSRGTHKHVNFVVEIEVHKASNITRSLQRLERGVNVWKTKKITDLDNVVNYVTKEKDHKVSNGLRLMAGGAWANYPQQREPPEIARSAIGG